MTLNGGLDGGFDSILPEPFSFSYEVKDPESGNDYSHKAESDGNTVRGEYKVLLPDGRRQKVSYTADSQGYNADVQYEGEASSGSGGQGGSSGGSGGYPSGRPGASGGGGGFSSSGTGGGSGYPSGGPGGFPSGGGGGFPSGGGGGRPSGNGYPSGGGGGAGSGGSQGYPSGRPNQNYLPPGK